MKKVLLIGYGKVGSAIYRALNHTPDFQVSAYDAYLQDSKVEHQLSEQLVSQSDIIILSVPDDTISQIVQDLVSFSLKSKTVLHTSGMVSLDALKVLQNRGASTAVLHPLQTFAEQNADPIIWKNIWCSFEGSDSAKENLTRLTSVLGAKLYPVTASQKKALHLAAVFAANLPVALLAAAEEILTDARMDKALLQPLIENLLKNYYAQPANRILSGPLQRGDIETVMAHLDFLDKPEYAKLKKLYQHVTQALLENPNLDIQNRDRFFRKMEEL